MAENTKERPILFQGAMVRAVLAGTKTQTRRALRIQPPQHTVAVGRWQDPPGYDAAWWAFVREGPVERDHPFGGTVLHGEPWRCPYGQPGDRLWVRESWMPDPPNDGSWAYTAWSGERIGQIASVPERFQHPAFCNYAASWLHGRVRWTPGIHMPRWASRIQLEITDVRVERLQAISEADVIAEGCPPEILYGTGWYRDLWETINGPGSWNANPFVWVVSFRTVQP